MQFTTIWQQLNTSLADLSYCLIIILAGTASKPQKMYKLWYIHVGLRYLRRMAPLPQMGSRTTVWEPLLYHNQERDGADICEVLYLLKRMTSESDVIRFKDEALQF